MEIFVWEGSVALVPNGKRVYKPACAKAEALARLANSKWLTEEALTQAQSLGFKVRFKSEWRPTEALLASLR